MKKKQVLFYLVGLVLILALGLLLIEVVPNPPVMAPQLRPTAGMIGAWKGTARMSASETTSSDLEVQVEIHPDAAVTGWVGGAKIATAKLANNRSWLGRRLGLRTDYIILGEAVLPSGQRRWQFQMPMALQEGSFKGALFIEGKPRRITLFRVQQISSKQPAAGMP